MRNDESCSSPLSLTTVASMVVIASLVAACAAPVGMQDLRAIVLADATQRSASYCAGYGEGCEVTVHQKDDGGWAANIVPIIRATSGVRVYGIDLDDFYIYRRDGSFESALRKYR